MAEAEGCYGIGQSTLITTRPSMLLTRAPMGGRGADVRCASVLLWVPGPMPSFWSGDFFAPERRPAS